MSKAFTPGQRFHAWLADGADEAILRWIFRCTLVVTVTVLALDRMQGWIALPDSAAAAPAEVREDSPTLDLPSLVPSILSPLLPGGDKRLMPLPQPGGAVAQPMTFELVGGGKLHATGSITAGISQSFAAEVGRHGDYIKTVVLNSPGGSVADAIAMGRLVRERKFTTEVEAGEDRAPAGPRAFSGGPPRTRPAPAT